MGITIRDELTTQRLRAREQRLRLAVQALEVRVSEKRARGLLVPLALRASVEDFRRQHASVRAELEQA